MLDSIWVCMYWAMHSEWKMCSHICRGRTDSTPSYSSKHILQIKGSSFVFRGGCLVSNWIYSRISFVSSCFLCSKDDVNEIELSRKSNDVKGTFLVASSCILSFGEPSMLSNTSYFALDLIACLGWTKSRSWSCESFCLFIDGSRDASSSSSTISALRLMRISLDWLCISLIISSGCDELWSWTAIKFVSDFIILML